MQSKSLLIAVAALALTATNVYAQVNQDLLEEVGLNEKQIEAFEEAVELKRSGKINKARDVLLKAGVGEDELNKIREAKKITRSAVSEAVENNDFESFKVVIKDSPLRDIITSESDFRLFVEAHDLKVAGQWSEADKILSDLGIDKGNKSRHRFSARQWQMNGLSEEQREAVRVARQANDKDSVRAILEEAGAMEKFTKR